MRRPRAKGLAKWRYVPGNKVQNIRDPRHTTRMRRAGFEEIRPIAEAMEQGGRKAAARAVTDAVLQKVCAIAGRRRSALQD